MLRTHALRVDLGGQPVLEDVDLLLHQGEAVALLGANGSGKSTLVRAILGLVPTASGRIALFDQPLGRAVPWSRIGYVPQRAQAAAGVPATALEVVASGLLSGYRLRPPADARRRAAAALTAMGLDPERHVRPVDELSGGQHQRVLVARALVRDPDLLILDEPIAGLDLASQQGLADALDERRQAGTAILVVLHETGPFAPVVRRSVVLDHGRVVHDGPSLATPVVRPLHSRSAAGRRGYEDEPQAEQDAS